ncbi:MAG: hypothetical protein JJU29_13590 [Verrucomicrobia bacterium]|nr:hypothetical protein [Verrucomicrobiota bacterium]MCH8510656.1 hypothetical protein [Kiritimatiellia bacterium]
MGKALKTFLILNLLLSIAVVALGVKIFMDREVVKARTVIQQNSLQQLSRNLEWGVDHDWNPDDAETGRFSVPQPVHKDELPDLVRTLEQLEGVARSRIVLTEQHWTTLVSTRRELADTQETLATTRQNLARTEENLASTQNTLETTQNNLQTAERNIRTLEGDKSALENQVRNLNEEITRKNDQITSLEVTLETREAELARAVALADRLRGIIEDQADVESIFRGRSAEILAVNDQWKFVVVDLGEVDQMELFLEALVHRGDEYLGKIVINRIEESVSIGEIDLNSVPPGATIQPGDRVFFN